MATQDHREIGNAVHFEHVDFRVLDHYQATLFYGVPLPYSID